MSADTQVVTVPDLGDFSDIPVIELLVKPGDRVAPETALVTLESDKATMDVPSPVAGTVEQLLVKVGDRVSRGTPIASVRLDAGSATAAALPSTMRPVRSVLDSQRTSVPPSASGSSTAEMVPLTVPPPFSFACASSVIAYAASSSRVKVMVPS